MLSKFIINTLWQASKTPNSNLVNALSYNQFPHLSFVLKLVWSTCINVSLGSNMTKSWLSNSYIFLFLIKKIHKWSKINCPPKFNMVVSSMGTSHVCNEIGAIGLLRIIPLMNVMNFSILYLIFENFPLTKFPIYNAKDLTKV